MSTRPMSKSLRRARAAAVPFIRQRLLIAPRMATASQRALPDFVVLGAMKAGSTSLYHAISQHPQVVEALRKGVHYFDSNTTRGLRWYRAHFPLRGELAAAGAPGRPALTGEASPSYLVHPRAPGNIADLLPETRLIAILRDPVRRAVSHYNHNARKSQDQGQEREPLSFADAIAAEEDRLAGEVERMLADPTYDSVPFSRYSYKARGRYAEQLERYAALFPRERILVLQSEAFYRDVQGTMDRVFDFLGLGAWSVQDDEPQNAYGYRVPEPSPDTLASLRGYFAPHNARLYAFLGEEYDWS